jgi:ribosomal protein S18 acetylase RimI-like enzyme
MTVAVMIKIIKAEEKHIPDICKLWWEFIWFHADIEPVFTPLDNAVEGFEKEFLRKQLKSDKSLVLVALDGAKTIGYSISELQDIPGSKIERRGHINHMHVVGNYRRQGIGQKMYREILKWFRTNDIKVLEIQITTKNVLASNFWRKQGFRDLQTNLIKEL